jgi:hypothetical protein
MINKIVWYPIECEHGWDCCPICDGILTNIDVDVATGQPTKVVKKLTDFKKEDDDGSVR